MGQAIKWIFDEGRPSGARSGGDPAKHAFEHGTDVFVREVLQNAIDQSLDSNVEVNFKFFELPAPEAKTFFSKMSLASLKPHLKGVAKTETQTGKAIKAYVKQLNKSGKLTLLRIEDKNTTGLDGPESGEESNFTALCKDELYSYKSSAVAAGSYGLGKSVLWSFSDMSTVLFCSNVNTKPKESPRFIGRANLASHEINGKWYDFSGWLGKEVEIDGGTRAESVWGTEAKKIANSLCLDRDDSPGTSIMIVGFRDPTADGPKGTKGFKQEFEEATAKYFWPAITGRKQLSVGIETPDSSPGRVDPRRDPEIAPFVACYQRAENADEKLENPGDVVVRPIKFEIPDKRDGGKTKKGEVLLTVRMADENEGEKLQNQIAYFRGAEMVVDYWNWHGSRQPLGTRPFHACLICGLAKKDADQTGADKDIDEFLRAAEPPSHREWISTEALKQTYKRGYNKALNELWGKVNTVIKELVVPDLKVGEKGPDKLRKRFPIGKRTKGSSSGPSERPIRFVNPQAYMQKGRWNIEGRLKLDEKAPYHVGWNAVIGLRALGENGQKLDPIPLKEVIAESREAEVSLVDGKAHINVTAGADDIRFLGESISLDHGSSLMTDIGAVELEIDGLLVTEDENA